MLAFWTTHETWYAFAGVCDSQPLDKATQTPTSPAASGFRCQDDDSPCMPAGVCDCLEQAGQQLPGRGASSFTAQPLSSDPALEEVLPVAQKIICMPAGLCDSLKQAGQLQRLWSGYC